MASLPEARAPCRRAGEGNAEGGVLRSQPRPKEAGKGCGNAPRAPEVRLDFFCVRAYPSCNRPSPFLPATGQHKTSTWCVMSEKTDQKKLPKEHGAEKPKRSRQSTPASSETRSTTAKRTSALTASTRTSPRRTVKKTAPPPEPQEAASRVAIRLNHETISLRAYFISEHRRSIGMPGDAESDWMEAERQIRAEIQSIDSQLP